LESGCRLLQAVSGSETISYPVIIENIKKATQEFLYRFVFMDSTDEMPNRF
jgi:hypothetical protein